MVVIELATQINQITCFKDTLLTKYLINFLRSKIIRDDKTSLVVPITYSEIPDFSANASVRRIP